MLAILDLSPTPTANFKVEIRDFDQTVIGNPAHDLIRLGLSLAAAAVVSDLPGLTIAEILEAMIAQYEAAFSAASDKTGHLEEPKTIRKVNRRAADANWTTLAAEDMDGQNFRLPLGRVSGRFSSRSAAKSKGFSATKRYAGSSPKKKVATMMRMFE